MLLTTGTSNYNVAKFSLVLDFFPGNRYRSTSRRQDMKRARSVEVISRANHEDDLVMSVSVTTKINNRQSLHEDMLKHTNEEKHVESDKPK